ncbi:MAG: hypothetical protein QOC92_3512, partial [Acidimicrobiaceae bacterium]
GGRGFESLIAHSGGVGVRDPLDAMPYATLGRVYRFAG